MIDEASLRAALAHRATELASTEPERAVRLFDGPREGGPDAPTIELFGRTAVVVDRRAEPSDAEVPALVELLRGAVPGLAAVVWKVKAGDTAARRGRVVFGEERAVARRVVENGVRYALRLLAHHDASFYRDTALLREHLRATSEGKRVLNLFAYTGSLGVAAAVGGAEVVHVDKNAELLDVAKTSTSMNGLPVRRADFIKEDYFVVARRLRKTRTTFDTVILDPPPLAIGREGRVDVEHGLTALVHKVKPLVRDGGELVLVNNAIFVSGERFLEEVTALAADGYGEIVGRVDVPADCRAPLARPLPADPAPFGHPTKILRLRLRTKAGA